jgi:hypothetical protein
MLRLQKLLIAAVAVALLAGCAGTSPPTRYYLMHPMQAVAPVQLPAGSESEPSIGIGPVLFPDYLVRQQIVTRPGANAVKMAEFDQWAEPLKQNFTRVLKENLATLLDTDYILLEPWPKSLKVEYRLIVEVIRFDVDPQNTAALTARWALTREADDILLLLRKSTHTADAGGADYHRIVIALNQVLDEFSREAADRIQAVHLREHGR